MAFNLCRLLTCCEGRRAGRQMAGSFKKYRQLFSVDVAVFAFTLCHIESFLLTFCQCFIYIYAENIAYLSNIVIIKLITPYYIYNEP